MDILIAKLNLVKLLKQEISDESKKIMDIYKNLNEEEKKILLNPVKSNMYYEPFNFLSEKETKQIEQDKIIRKIIVINGFKLFEHQKLLNELVKGIKNEL
jgi:hypothetical protein